MTTAPAHAERPARLRDGKTYCSCGQLWPCPHSPDGRWAALKDYLSAAIEADEAVRWGMVNDGETEKAAPFGGLVSANRSTLKKMQELEQS